MSPGAGDGDVEREDGIGVVTGAEVVSVIGAVAETDSVANDGMGTRMGGGIGAGTGRSCAAAVRARVVSQSANTALFMGTSAFSAGTEARCDDFIRRRAGIF